jgi:hypothetical protein
MNGEISFEMAQALDLKRAIWKKRIQGVSVSEIADSTGIEEKHVSKMLDEEYAKRQQELDDMVAHEKIMDLERLDELIFSFFRIAKIDGVKIEKMVKGELVESWDADVPVKAAAIFLKIIELKSRILGYDPDPRKPAKPIDQGWIAKRSQEVKALLN